MDWIMMKEGDQDHEKFRGRHAQLQSLPPADLLVQDPLHIFSSESCVSILFSSRMSSQLKNCLRIALGWLSYKTFPSPVMGEHFILRLWTTLQTIDKKVCYFLVSPSVTSAFSPLPLNPVFTQPHGHPGPYPMSTLEFVFSYLLRLCEYILFLDSLLALTWESCLYLKMKFLIMRQSWKGAGYSWTLSLHYRLP